MLELWEDRTVNIILNSEQIYRKENGKWSVIDVKIKWIIQKKKTIQNLYNSFKRINIAFKRLSRLKNTSRLLIIALIIWNIVLTINLIHPQIITNIPQFTDAENELIMQLEEIPTEQLKF